MKNNELDEHHANDFWKYFIPKLTEDVAKLPAAGPGGSCWVTNTLGNIQQIENRKSSLGDRELKELQNFVSEWRKQKGYPQRLGEEAKALAKSSRKWGGFLKRGMLMEEFQNLVGIRGMMEKLKSEMEEFSPEGSKELVKEIAWLDNEFKEQTVSVSPEWEVQRAPWYENRLPTHEAEDYNHFKKRVNQGICPHCDGKLTLTEEKSKERKGMLEDGNNNLERIITRYKCTKCGKWASIERLEKAN